MFLPTKAHTDSIPDYQCEPSIRIGRNVPKDAVNLAYYFNPTASDSEKILCADAPRKTIDHYVITKYLYKFGCPDKDNSNFKYFPATYFYQDDEGYSGHLPLKNIKWYEKQHVTQKHVEQTKTYTVSNKNDIVTSYFYKEDDFGNAIDGAKDDGTKIINAFYGNLFLDTTDYVVVGYDTSTIDLMKYKEVIDLELKEENIDNTKIDTYMKNPILSGSTTGTYFPPYLWQKDDGLYDNFDKTLGNKWADGNNFDGYVSAKEHPLEIINIEKDPLPWINEGTGSTYTQEYGAVFLVIENATSGDYVNSAGDPYNPFRDDGEYGGNNGVFSGAKTSGTANGKGNTIDDFIFLLQHIDYTFMDTKRDGINSNDASINENSPSWDGKNFQGVPLSMLDILTAYAALPTVAERQAAAQLITIERMDWKTASADTSDPDISAATKKNRTYGASYKMYYTIQSNDADGNWNWNVYANYAGELQKEFVEISQKPTEWDATCRYTGIVRKVWYTYDGTAMYRGAVTKGEGIGNINPELSPDILLFPNDDGFLRYQITYSENNPTTNEIETKTVDIYKIEAEQFYITDVFKNGIPCFYKYKLKNPIHDYRGPDMKGFYSGDAVKVFTSNLKNISSNDVYQLKLTPVETEEETYIANDVSYTKTVATKYEVDLYSSFISCSTNTYKACYNAFIETEDEATKIKNSGLDEEIYNAPFMFNKIDYSIIPIDERVRTNRIKIFKPNIIEDTRAYVEFEYKVRAYCKIPGQAGDVLEFVSKTRHGKILNKEYAVESEYNKFQGRGMIISPKQNGGYMTPFDIILTDQAAVADTMAPVVTSNNVDNFIFVCEIEENILPDSYKGAINIKCNPDGSGYITAETTLETGFLDEINNTYTNKLIYNNPYLVENGKIYGGYMVKCLDVRNITVKQPREEGLLESWNPLIQFGHYSQVLSQYGAKLKVAYSMPEYDTQYFSETYGKPYVEIKKEKAKILNSHMIKVRCHPLFTYDVKSNIKVYKEKFDELIELEVLNVSFSDGILILKQSISENEIILVDYIYLEEFYNYRGYFRNEADFARIDLNPNQYHTYSDMNYDPSELRPTTNLFNKTLYFYLKPSILYTVRTVNGIDVIDEVQMELGKDEYSLYHTIDEYAPESEMDIYIGSVYIRSNTSLYSTILIDTRTRGGGVIESMKDELRRQLEPESDFYLDIGCYDGTPYQENAVIIVRLDNSILKEFGGRFKQGDIEAKVKKFLGLGVYPIIEFVDSYAKQELPQYNLTVEDEYTNVMNQTLEFTLECVGH